MQNVEAAKPAEDTAGERAIRTCRKKVTMMQDVPTLSCVGTARSSGGQAEIDSPD
jgi:hypothetical protein